MYNFSNRFKIFSMILIILGSLGWFYSYSKSHLSIDEVKQLIVQESHNLSHLNNVDQLEYENENISS